MLVIVHEKHPPCEECLNEGRVDPEPGVMTDGIALCPDHAGKHIAEQVIAGFRERLVGGTNESDG